MAKTVNQLVRESDGDEQALYILLASSGMRISKALAIERRNFTNDGCTIQVRQQVHREKPLIVSYLKTDAVYRDIDLHPEVAECLRVFICGKDGLLFKTRNGTPHLHNNIEERWLTERLKAMQLDEPGMGWHAFRRFRNTWLRGRSCQEDIKNFWIDHKPRTMSELYSHLFRGRGASTCGKAGKWALDSIFLLILVQTVPKDLCDQTFRLVCKWL